MLLGFAIYVQAIICDALCDLVPFVQFKKREKKPHGGVLLLIKLQDLACKYTKSNTPLS